MLSGDYLGTKGMRLNLHYVSGGIGFYDPVSDDNVPPRTEARVQVNGIKALREIPAQLTDPVIQVNEGSLSVRGSVENGQFLEYRGGDTVTVYDGNWNRLKECHASLSHYEISQGWSEVGVSTKQVERLPWLEVQFLTEGEQWILVNKPYIYINCSS